MRRRSRRRPGGRPAPGSQQIVGEVQLFARRLAAGQVERQAARLEGVVAALDLIAECGQVFGRERFESGHASGHDSAAGAPRCPPSIACVPSAFSLEMSSGEPSHARLRQGSVETTDPPNYRTTEHRPGIYSKTKACVTASCRFDRWAGLRSRSDCFCPRAGERDRVA